MENLILYHGSSVRIEKPQFGFGNINNDYGLGFYCTESLDLAKEWACTETEDGFANKYSFDITGLSVLSLTNGKYNILNWLSILLENRKFRISGNISISATEYIAKYFSIDYKDYDVIRGYHADDSYFSFATAFLNNNISLSQLEKAMVLGKLGEQVMIKSEKAFKALHFEEAISVNKDIYYPKKSERDTLARNEYRTERNREPIENETYVLDIIRERWNNDDSRLQRVILG